MSDKESDDDMQDAELGSQEAEQNGDVVKYGELSVSGQDSVAAGVAAGNIHLQSADAATLALPEVSNFAMSGDTCEGASLESSIDIAVILTACRLVIKAKALLQGSKEAREQQERLLQAVEERRALRETSVPTSDADVRAALRAIGEPITLFGEQQVCMSEETTALCMLGVSTAEERTALCMLGVSTAMC